MKKLEKIFVLIIILFTLNITNSFAETGIVNTTAVRLRKEASTSSEIIVNIYEDDEVEILEKLDEWYKVKYKDNIGYVKKEFLSIKSSNNKENNSNTSLANNNTTNTQSNNVVDNEVSNDTVSDSNVNNNITTSNESDNQGDVNCVTNSETNVRMVPSIMSTIKDVLPAEKQLTRISQINNWVQVTDGNITGWVLLNKVVQPPVSPEPVKDNQTPNIDNQETQTNDDLGNQSKADANKKGKVNVETANVREKANTKATIVGFLDYGDEVTIVSEDGDWYQIQTKDISGYVSKRLIDILNENEITSRGLTDKRENDTTVVDEDTNNVLTETLNSTQNEEEEPLVVAVSDNEKKKQDIVNYAKQYLNYPYVSGGKNPSTGFDCSGFTKYIFSNFGYNLGNTAASQNSIGTEVSRDNLQLGDLILFYDEGKSKIGHTGIYIGNSEFIHAANPSRGVVIDNIKTNSYYNERFVSARRIVE